MKPHFPLFTLVLLASVSIAQAADLTIPDLLPTPGNRIVGLWANTSRVGSCDTGELGPPGNQTVMFNAGGTFVDNPRFPAGGVPTPGGVVQRSIGLGTWNYNHRSRQYTLRQQFDLFLSTDYDGYTVIERTMRLSNDGNHITGPVVATRFNADGDLVFQLCGIAESTRL